MPNNNYSEAEVSDIKKAQLLLRSVTQTNPTHAPGWIAVARLEEETGKLTAARAAILKGCQACPRNEDVWLEAARLAVSTPAAKSILAKAVEHCATSVSVWLEAASLESDPAAKKAVLRRALELVPTR
jgi:pre-mRNA-processing factor 6